MPERERGEGIDGCSWKEGGKERKSKDKKINEKGRVLLKKLEEVG